MAYVPAVAQRSRTFGQGSGFIADNIFLLDISPTALAGLALLVTELIPSLRTYIRSKPGQEVCSVILLTILVLLSSF